jgi:hypothetical protein
MRLGDIMRVMWEVWAKDRTKVARVLEGYQALAHQHTATLADIAQRNGVFASPPDGADAIMLARAAGRREAALEIFQLAKTDLAVLFAALETKPSQRS